MVYRHMAFLGEESILAAEASECAADQGKFWEYHEALYRKQSGREQGTFSKDNLKRYATELGLDSSQFDPCIDTDRYRGRVQAETEQGRAKGVTRTPTLFINGQKFEGVPPYEQLVQMIRSIGGPAVAPSPAPKP